MGPALKLKAGQGVLAQHVPPGVECDSANLRAFAGLL